MQAGFTTARDARDRERDEAEARRSVALAALLTQGINGPDAAFGEQFTTADQITQRIEQIRAEYEANGQSLAEVDIRDVLPRLGIDVTIPADAGFISAESFMAYLGTFDGSARFTAADFAGAFADRGYGRYIAGDAELNPGLVRRMESDPRVRAYVEATFEAAERYGLDPEMLANQFWQESRFNPNAQSDYARGIAQFTPATGRSYGLNDNNWRDPFRSIEAGARHMRDLTDEYGGDQRLALIAYNGGGRAIDFVERRTGDTNVTFEDWMGFMARERALKGEGPAGAWRNETFEYARTIAGGVGGPAPIA